MGIGSESFQPKENLLNKNISPTPLTERREPFTLVDFPSLLDSSSPNPIQIILLSQMGIKTLYQYGLSGH